jgi:hypothetical protein
MCSGLERTPLKNHATRGSLARHHHRGERKVYGSIKGLTTPNCLTKVPAMALCLNGTLGMLQCVGAFN